MKIFKFTEVTSTQDLAKEYLERNDTPAVFITKGQTAGYGKQGRTFYSPKNTGIYYTIAIPNFVANKNKIGLLTPAIGVRIVKVLINFFHNSQFKLKWVNDIYLHNKKVGGILTEFHHGLAIGVGINVSTKKFPSDIQKKAGSITNNTIDNKQLCKTLIETTLKASKNYDKSDFLPEYRYFSNVLNKVVTLRIGNKYISGKAIDFDDYGRIIISNHNHLEHYSSGEIDKVKINQLI